MFPKYALFIALALQILCCDSVDSAGVPRGMPHRADCINRNTKLYGRKSQRIRTSTIVAAADITKSVPVVSVEPEITLNAFDLCLCGAFATAFGDFVMHPVDTIKVSQQVILSAIHNTTMEITEHAMHIRTEQ